ncbi:MAG TPA: SDR family NAD(P)-dependent oxidoreductase [Actinocrinis sp.]|nr:SDR family NAD(P)-dependent oxidoreductase [Actinocrinis sp.]
MDTTRLGTMADTALDRTLAGYGSIGFLIRRRWWPADPRPDALAGKTAVVTGAKAGLGKATACGLARLGAEVRLVVRGRAGGEAACAEIRRAVPGARLTVDECDVSLLAEVRDYAAALTGPVDVLIHNAGVMPTERKETAEGNELMFATHVLGPHLLTALLRPAMTAQGSARVIWVSSGGMYGQPLRVDDLQYDERPYRPTTGYARTKRMQVVLAKLWNDHLEGSGVVVHSAHPGWATTPGLAKSLTKFAVLARPILRSPDQGADTFVWLAAAEEPGRRAGLFWHDRAVRPEYYLNSTRESAADRGELWDACQELAGLPGVVEEADEADPSAEAGDPGAAL